MSPEELLAALRPRLYGSDELARLRMPLPRRPVAEGIDGLLCVDGPDTVVSLTPEQAAATGLEDTDLWLLALGQIDDGLPTTTEEIGDGVSATFGASFFVASRLLDLRRFVGDLPPGGVFAAVPTRHVLLTHPVVDVGALRALRCLLLTAARLHAKGPGSISPSVYWWRADRPLTRLTATVGRVVNVSPSDELMAVLNSLPAAPDP